MPRRPSSSSSAPGRAGSTSPSPTPTSTAAARGRREPRSSPSRSTPTTARVTTAPATSRATSGTSGPIARHRWTPRRPPRELQPLTAERRRGRPPRLSRDAVIDAARVIVERDGIDALTMRRVARELGSSAMAIYRHVRDKDELLVLLLDRLAAELPRPRFSDDPRRRVQQASRFMRDGLARYGWVGDVLAQGDLIAPEILWLIEEIVAGLMACGLSESQAADGYRTIWQFTVGELIIRRDLGAR